MIKNSLWTFIGVALGAASAFTFFAMAFNGAPWAMVFSLMGAMAVLSALAGYFLKEWRGCVLGFFAPHWLVFALFIMGSIEKGGWSLSLPLIAGTTAAILLPASLSARISKNRS